MSAGDDAAALRYDNAALRHRINEAEQLVLRGVEAFRLTREYVGAEMLPAQRGWDWFEWCAEAAQVMGVDVEDLFPDELSVEVVTVNVGTEPTPEMRAHLASLITPSCRVVLNGEWL